MSSQAIKIRARDGGEFDCYLSLPDTSGAVPAVVLASAVHGVDADVRGIADAFAAKGFIAAAPDLFWRTLPGPLPARGQTGRRTIAAAARTHQGRRSRHG